MGGRTDKLKTYRDKRDFRATSEPSGNGASAASSDAGRRLRFVIQQHAARSLHWDLRLEHEGVLLSWAVPKGVPMEPRVNRLAVRTEDHPMEYIDFHGEIPAGEYGAGTMTIWDEGWYELEELTDEKVTVVLHGRRVQGTYHLFQTRDNQWMIRRRDPPSDPDRQPMPQRLVPQLAKVGPLPPQEGDEWAYEIKWDGVRALVYIEGGRVTIHSRNLNDVTHQYPELRALGRQAGARELILDGEIVALDERGIPSFERLQQRLGLKNERTIERRARDFPAVFMIFDVLWIDGHSTMDLTYVERRERLEQLGLAGPSWQVPSYSREDGQALLALSRDRGLEGIIAKRVDSDYVPGRRTSAWLKIKNQRRQEFVIGGYTCGSGARQDAIGSLLLGYHDISLAQSKATGEPQRLVFAGSVGTGFSAKTLALLQERLDDLHVGESPFQVNSPGDQIPASKWKAIRAKEKQLADIRTVFARPDLVCEVEFTEWTQAGTLRHPSFKGLREDKDPLDVVREPDPEIGRTGDVAELVDKPKQSRRTATDATRKPGKPAKAAARKDGEATLRFGRYRVPVKNLDKVMYPRTGFTKGQVIDYYVAIAPVLLPHVRNRPLTMKRYPNGVEGEFFYEKRCPSYAPDFVQQTEVWSDGNDRHVSYCMLNNLATLAWVANLADLEIHTLLAKARDVQQPTMMVFDLDPGAPANIVQCAEVALELRELFTNFELECFPKTSGSKGMQLYVPLNTKVTYATTKPFAHAIARILEREHPELVVSKMSKELRKGKVLVDWSQNDDHKTTVTVYSLRAKDAPTVSTPLTWDEVERLASDGNVQAVTFLPHEVLERVERLGDLFEPVLSMRQKLPKLG